MLSARVSASEASRITGWITSPPLTHGTSAAVSTCEMGVVQAIPLVDSARPMDHVLPLLPANHITYWLSVWTTVGARTPEA